MKFREFNLSSEEPAKKLVLFFHGWGMSPELPFLAGPNGFDLIVLYNYSNLQFPAELLLKINSYEDIIIIAWSFGVWVAEQAIPIMSFAKKMSYKISINGSSLPVDSEYGIDPEVFQKTLEALRGSIESRNKFYRRMFSGKKEYEAFMQNPPQRTLQSQVNELELLGQASKNASKNYEKCFWTKAFISKKDRIIPTKAQINFWEQAEVPIFELEGGHNPFNFWSGWDEIIGFFIS